MTLLSLDTPFDSQHFSESVLGAGFDLEAIPLAPEVGIHSWIAELGCMRVDGACTVNLTQFSFQGSETQAHLCRLAIGKDFQSAFVYRTRGRQAVVCDGLCNVDGEHLHTMNSSVLAIKQDGNVTSNLSSSATA
jgi:hypothetical protein